MLKLWLISKSLPCKEISNQEQKWAHNLSNLRRNQFIHSRSYIRHVLSILFDKPSLEVPLYAPPSEPIKILSKNMGFISISHSKNNLLVGWSECPIGVDLEMIERSSRVNNIVDKFINEDEKYLFSNSSKSANLLAMKLWTLKEASVKYYGHSKKTFLLDWTCNLKNKTVNHEKYKISAPFISLKFLNFQIAIVTKYLKKNLPPTICLVD